MKSTHFIALVAGGALVTAIVQGLTQTPAPDPVREQKKARRRITSDIVDIDVGAVFPEELEKFKAYMPLRRRDFENAYSEFERALEGHSDYVVTQLVLGVVMAVISSNSCKGISHYVPAGLAYDNILRCEMDSSAIIHQEGCEDTLMVPLAKLYRHLARN